MTTILWTGNDPRRRARTIAHACSWYCQQHGMTPPSWIQDDLMPSRNFEVSMLWVNEYDLQLVAAGSEKMPWRDVNVISAETYWQIQHYAHLLDPAKKYITICDSWANDASISAAFPNINFVANISMFADPAWALDKIHFFDPQYRPIAVPMRDRPYNTFALIGRKDQYRDNLILLLRKRYLAQSLIKYSGNVVSADVPDFDELDFTSASFHTAAEEDQLFGSMRPQLQCYQKFKFETAIETTAWHTGGWPVLEYTITEKTLKPLMLGVPCLMLGPQGYHDWLKQQFDIDIGLGCFDTAFDSEASDFERRKSFVNSVESATKTVLDEPDSAVIKRNRRALVDLQDFTHLELDRCAELLCRFTT